MHARPGAPAGRGSVSLCAAPVNPEAAVPGPELTVTVLAAHVGPGVVVRGELDHFSAGQLVSALTEVCERGRVTPASTPRPETLLDLTTVTFMDSGGLHALEAAAAEVDDLVVLGPAAEQPRLLLLQAIVLGWLPARLAPVDVAVGWRD